MKRQAFVLASLLPVPASGAAPPATLAKWRAAAEAGCTMVSVPGVAKRDGALRPGRYFPQERLFVPAGPAMPGTLAAWYLPQEEQALYVVGQRAAGDHLRGVRLVVVHPDGHRQSAAIDSSSGYLAGLRVASGVEGVQVSTLDYASGPRYSPFRLLLWGHPGARPPRPQSWFTTLAFASFPETSGGHGAVHLTETRAPRSFGGVTVWQRSECGAPAGEGRLHHEVYLIALSAQAPVRSLGRGVGVAAAVFDESGALFLQRGVQVERWRSPYTEATETITGFWLVPPAQHPACD